jgi:hypothetical protein
MKPQAPRKLNQQMIPSFCFSFIFRYETVKNILSCVYAHSGQKVALKGHNRIVHTIRGAMRPVFAF